MKIESKSAALGFALISFFLSCQLSCEIFALHAGDGASSKPLKTLFFLEKGEPFFPKVIQRIGPDEEIEVFSLLESDDDVFSPEQEGTWIFYGSSCSGSLKAISSQGVSRKLPRLHFGALLEIQPDTHPQDIRPSDESTAGKSCFAFTVLKEGEPLLEPVRYCASRLGRIGESNGGSKWMETDRETMMGKGRVYIDAPGIWWITAEFTDEEGSMQRASLTFTVPSEPGPDHYTAFTKDGVYLDSLDRIASELAWAEVIFLGEQHNDPVAHWLEKEIFAAVHRLKGSVALSMEMFDRDVQVILNGYLRGDYMERHFLEAARPWPEYASDYRPLVEYAKACGLPVIAANAPRRLVNL
ncbi:MAG: ChaN family lipoprotein, partial [Planctomycetes bacterium]|nr:ChaN family lipoprotein [Planctomycetota bacterium]